MSMLVFEIDTDTCNCEEVAFILHNLVLMKTKIYIRIKIKEEKYKIKFSSLQKVLDFNGIGS